MIGRRLKNSKIEISRGWDIVHDVFYDLDPWSNSSSNKAKDDDLKEDLLLMAWKNYHLDLGWYSTPTGDVFQLFLFHGIDWHNCHLLEKRRITNYNVLVETTNAFIKNVELDKYKSIDYEYKSIDEYSHVETVITIE